MIAELARRIAITIGALLLYRLGTYIPLPGIDPAAWEQIFRSQAGGILGSLDVMAGGGIHRLALFALNVTPYVSAAILLQLAMMVSHRLRALAREGARGRAIIERYTRILALVLAVLQSCAIAVALQGVGAVVTHPGLLFIVSTVITLCGGMLFLVWLIYVVRFCTGYFFAADGLMGFLNHPLVQFPCFDFVPAAVDPWTGLIGLFAFLVVCVLLAWAVSSAFSDHHPVQKNPSV